MKIFFRTLLFSILIQTACKKTDPSPEPEPAKPVTPVTPKDTMFKCEDLPPDPVPFAWTDSTTNPDNNVKAFFFNPLKSDEVIAVVEGDAFGYNKLVNI